MAAQARATGADGYTQAEELRRRNVSGQPTAIDSGVPAAPVIEKSKEKV
jgi:hypothetical protein